MIELAHEQSLGVNNMPEEGMHAVYDSGFVLGKGTAADFWALMRERTGLAGDDDILTEKTMSGFVVRSWMMAVVKQLHDKGYVVGILSDQTDWLDILDKKYDFYSAFDHVYNSFYMGKGKQDISLFSDVAEDLGVDPSAILFVDDDAGNIERAEKMRFNTIHYKDKYSFLTSIKKLLE
ncbi:MAG: HAD-IA family hydrolase [Gammaproteobacteria bacterium]|nr:HAD-IA family hydrolase [Gammaproteobacteria bacterium]